MERGSSNTTWYVVGAVVVIAVLAIWYYLARSPAASTQPSAVEQVQTQPLSSGNTTLDISADLDQMSDDAALLDQDAAASASAVSDF